MKKYFFLFVAITSLYSCEKPLDYKYQDKKQINICQGIDINLANEAYYSFRQDIAEYALKSNQTEYLDYQFSLALYIFNGAAGKADYKAIASQHSLDILEKLKQEGQIWENPSTGELNYHSEFISCLIENIQKEEIRSALLSLREINSINKVSLAEDYRTTIIKAETDKAYAMFIAFETYYKYLSKIKK